MHIPMPLVVLSALLYVALFSLILWVLVDVIRFGDKNNCILWAVPRWLLLAIQGCDAYLILRLSFIRWGFLHCLLGRYDVVTGQLAMTSYKPPPGHRKSGFAPTFRGTVVDGDRPTRHGDLT